MDYVDEVLNIFDEYKKQHHSELLLKEDLKKVVRGIRDKAYDEGYSRGYDEGYDEGCGENDEVSW